MDGLVQDCSIFIAKALDMLQSYINPSIYPLKDNLCPHIQCSVESTTLKWIDYSLERKHLV